MKTSSLLVLALFLNCAHSAAVSETVKAETVKAETDKVETPSESKDETDSGAQNLEEVIPDN